MEPRLGARSQVDSQSAEAICSCYAIVDSGALREAAAKIDAADSLTGTGTGTITANAPSPAKALSA